VCIVVVRAAVLVMPTFMRGVAPSRVVSALIAVVAMAG